METGASGRLGAFALQAVVRVLETEPENVLVQELQTVVRHAREVGKKPSLAILSNVQVLMASCLVSVFLL